jgi:hypothetical protein
MFDIGELFTLSFWFVGRPLSGTWVWILSALFGAVLAFALVISVLLKLKVIMEYRGVWRQASSFLWTMSVIALIWTFFFYQGVPILSARAWFFPWLIIAVVWKYFILKYFLKIRKKYHLSESKK